MSDSVRRVGPTKEQLSELKTTRAYKLAKEKMVTTMSDNKTTSNDNDLLSNPREHDYLGHYDQPPEDSEQYPKTSVPDDNYRQFGQILNELNEWVIWVSENADDDGLCRVNQEELLKTLQIVSQTIDEKRSTVDDRDESTHLRWENLRQVDIEAIAPEPPFVTIHFYANDPDSMQTLRRYLNADEVLWAVQEFDQWLRARIKYQCEGKDDSILTELGRVRETLWDCFTHRGLSIWEE